MEHDAIRVGDQRGRSGVYRVRLLIEGLLQSVQFNQQSCDGGAFTIVDWYQCTYRCPEIHAAPQRNALAPSRLFGCILPIWSAGVASAGATMRSHSRALPA
jgi:hypothetical protein